MRFNGIDLNKVHPAVSRAQEFPPGMAKREISTLETTNREIVTDVHTAQDEYTVRVNIAARTYQEAMQARERLAAWASSSGKQTAWLEPTHAHGRAYKAIVKNIGRIEKRFGTVDVVFMLPDPVLYDSMVQSHQATDRMLVFMAAGSAIIQPEISFKASEEAEGLRITHNGKTIIAVSGRINTGDTVDVVLETGALLINGTHAESRFIYTECDLDDEFAKGRHEMTVSARGTLKARWRNGWQ